MNKILTIMLVSLACASSAFAQTQKAPVSNENTPQATGGANYEGNVFTGLDDYNKKKQELLDKAANIKKEQDRLDAEYKLYKQKQLQMQQIEAQKQQAAKKTTKAFSAQEYFDRQTKIMQGKQ
jgi:Skp family chaperone for outer membrane proteins